VPPRRRGELCDREGAAQGSGRVLEHAGAQVLGRDQDQVGPVGNLLGELAGAEAVVGQAQAG
jgi:hypothetical protein